MVITHKIKMDLSRRGNTPVVYMVQGDSNTRALEILLYDNGQPWAIPQGVTAAVAFQKPDGTRGLYDKLPDKSAATTLDRSTVTAILAPEVLTCAGQVRVAIVLYDAEMDTLATFTMMVVVEANPAAGKQISNNYYYLQNMEQVNAAYSELLTRLDELKQNGGGGGISSAEKSLILTLFRNAAYASADMGDTLTQLEALWSGSGDSGGETPDEPDEPVTPTVTLSRISATYSGGSVPVGTSVTELTGIVVIAHYSDGTSATVTGYTLSGTIAEGSNTITVNYGGKTTTFTVVGVAESSGGIVNLFDKDTMVVSGAYVGMQGAINNSANSKYAKIPISVGTYALQKGSGWGATTTGHPAFIDADGNVLARIGNLNTSGAGGSADNADIATCKKASGNNGISVTVLSEKVTHFIFSICINGGVDDTDSTMMEVGDTCHDYVAYA